MAAISNWTAAAVDFPKLGPPREKLGFALKQATLASLARGWPTGEARLTDQSVELFAHGGKAMDPLDFEGRALMIYCGAGLQHLKLVLQRHGCLGRVDLFPDLADPKLAARVHLGCGGLRDALEQQLSDALEVGEAGTRRVEQPVADATLELLGRAGVGERGWVEFAQSESSRQRLAGLLGRGAGRLHLKEVRFQNETLVRAADGSWESGGFTSTTLHERFSRWRRPAVMMNVRAATTTSQSSHGTSEPAALKGSFAVLKTKTDDKHGWLAAGQAMARLLLHARALGLAATPFLDALRPPELRAELRTTIGHKGFVQMILHFTAPRLAGDIPADAPRSRTAMTSLT